MLANPMRSTYSLAFLALVLVPVSRSIQGQQIATVIAVDAAHPGPAISPAMFGIFFEDINFGADGGLYPQRTRNRSFAFDQPLAGWHAILPLNAKGELDSTRGELDLRADESLNPSNPHYLRVRAYVPGYGLWNSGYRGIGVESGAEYRFSAYVRTGAPKSVRATITDGNHEIGSGTLTGFDGQWKRYETVIRANATVQHAQFNLYLDEPGYVDLDMISLFPVDTWNHRPMDCAKTWCNCLPTCIRASFAFPEAASSKASGWRHAIAGRPRLATSTNDKPSSIAGTMSLTTARRRIISNHSALASTSTSNWRKTSGPRRCPF